MEKQTSFAAAEYEQKKKTTRRDRFLLEMEKVVPWTRLIALIEPHYPKGKRGRPPMGVEKMLRLYFLQNWYALADEAIEDAIYDSQALRNFAGIDLVADAVPDATTLLHFRRLLESHNLTEAIFEAINAMLRERGIQLREGTMVDATIIAAPSSTKNQSGERDPDMHQTKKGNQWYFGMKAHTGTDVDSGTVHSLHSTAANVSDLTPAHELLHGEEKSVFMDAGYTGAQKRPQIVEKAPEAQFHIAAKRSIIKAMANGLCKQLAQGLERLKAQVRARVEHPFHIIKNLFLHRKTRYRGVPKNDAHLHTLFALANLVIAKRRLLSPAA